MSKSGSDQARLPDNTYLCQTCGTTQGYVWPTASNSDSTHPFVERCDLCARFDSDQDAANFIANLLIDEGFAIERGSKPINGYPQPWIRVLHERTQK